MADGLPLTLFSAGEDRGVRIVPAPRWRRWMDETHQRNANRCLPLLVANESGWSLLNPHGFEAVWDGRAHPDGVSIVFDEPVPLKPHLVSVHFGHGVISFGVPWLFRTPPGWNLLARGPANWPIDGACALEGVIETDWAVATFTMNWKLTRPGLSVRFEAGDPYCMVVPQRRGELESFRPDVRPLAEQPDVRAQVRRWTERRHQTQVRKFLAEYSEDFAEDRDSWEKDYFRGRLPDGAQAPEHQTKLRLRPFTDDQQADAPVPDEGAGGAGA